MLRRGRPEVGHVAPFNNHRHTQIVSIIGLLRLGWPKSVEPVMDSVGLDLVNIGGTKPECAAPSPRRHSRAAAP